MKKHIFLLLSITILSACATFQQQKIDWTGQNFDNFIIQYGVPTSNHTLQNGNIAYSFIKPCQYTQGQEEIVAVVNADNTISGISRVSSCPSVQQEKQHNEYVDPQVNYLKEQKAKKEKELLEDTQNRIYEIEHELFQSDYDSSYKLAVSSAEYSLQLKEQSYAEMKNKYEENHQKHLNILKKYGIKNDPTVSNMIAQDNERLAKQQEEVQKAKKELEQAQTNLKDWENHRASLKKELEELNKIKDKYKQDSEPLEELLNKLL